MNDEEFRSIVDQGPMVVMVEKGHLLALLDERDKLQLTLTKAMSELLEMNDAIKNAIDAAAREICFGLKGEDCDQCVDPVHCCRSASFAATAISVVAIFLDALPDEASFDASQLAEAVRKCRE